MTKVRITTPVADFTGVSAGVNFTKGAAEVEYDPDDVQHELTRAVRYFQSQGYGIEELDEPEPDTEEPADPDDGPKAPSRSASKADWVAYAVTHGVDADEAEKLTRDQLAERFLDQKGADQ